jgi:hypothetical protein
MSWHEAHRSEIDENLDHFLAGASYQKALLHLEAGTRWPCGKKGRQMPAIDFLRVEHWRGITTTDPKEDFGRFAGRSMSCCR